MPPSPIFLFRVAAVVRRLASGVTTAATSKSEEAPMTRYGHEGQPYEGTGNVVRNSLDYSRRFAGFAGKPELSV